MLCRIPAFIAIVAILAVTGLAPAQAEDDLAISGARVSATLEGVPLVASDRAARVRRKVDDALARCRAVARRSVPCVDWSDYRAAAAAASKSDHDDPGSHILGRDTRGTDDMQQTLQTWRERAS
jgi:hypothetical protein